ncbi:MAG TPA: methyltransferase domain-containing protein [Bdellovibrionota bacterium]|nr:methyltransferase domain-containing protein [Bdellovibrionota bacterium]
MTSITNLAGSTEFFAHLTALSASKAQKKALEALRRYLGPEREALPPDYMETGAFLEAYLRYYLPLHLPELPWILTQAARFGLAPEAGQRVLDMGSGPGTLSLALALWAKSRKIEGLDFTLVDRSKRALTLAEELFRVADAKARPQLWVDDLSNSARKFKGAEPFDWIFAGHMLNEWERFEDKKDLLDSVMRYLMHERSVLVLIEPPLREPTLDLMKLRDFWVRELGGHVLLPCPAGTEKCPALKAHLGWCYSKVPRTWARESGWAPLDAKVEGFLGQELHYNGFSYVVLAASIADMDHFANYDKNRRVAFSDERRRPSLWCRDGRIMNSSRRPKHRGELLTPAPNTGADKDTE